MRRELALAVGRHSGFETERENSRGSGSAAEPQSAPQSNMSRERGAETPKQKR